MTVDTGTYLIYGVASQVAALYAAIPSATYDNTTGLYSSTSSISVLISNRESY